jgi:hypothetical protein
MEIALKFFQEKWKEQVGDTGTITSPSISFAKARSACGAATSPR